MRHVRIEHDGRSLDGILDGDRIRAGEVEIAVGDVGSGCRR